MISLRVELVGDRVGILLDDAARNGLGVAVGDFVELRAAPAEQPVLASAEVGDDGRHARGRAFLRRYRRTLSAL
jgi:hypothetical protein